MAGAVFTGGGDMCLLICGDEPYRYAKELGVTIEDITIGFAVSDSPDRDDRLPSSRSGWPRT